MAYEFGDITPNPDNLPENIAQSRQGVTPVYTPWAGFKAAFSTQNITETIYDKVLFNSIGDGGQALSPTDIKTNYGLATDESLTADQVEMIINKRQADTERNFILSNIDPYAMGNVAAPLSGGLLGGMSDPVVLAAGFALEGLAAKAVQGLSRTGQTISQLSMARRVTIGGAVGLTEGVIEDQILRNSAQTFGTEYTMNDSLMNIGLSVIAGGIFEGLNRSTDFTIEADAAAKRDLAVLSQGKKPRDIDGPVRDKAIHDTRTSNGPTPKEPGTFFSSHRSNNGVLNESTQANYTGKYGGQVFVDDKGLATARVSNGLDGANGQLVQAKIDTEKFLDVSSDIPSDLKGLSEAKLSPEFKAELKDAFKGKKTVKEVLDHIDNLKTSEGRDAIQKAVNDSIMEEGFDGIKYKALDSQGKELNSDAIAVFNKDKVSVKGFEKTEPPAIPLSERVTNSGQEANAKYLESKESNLLSNKEADDAFDSVSPKTEPTSLDKELAESKTRLSDIKSSIVEGTEISEVFNKAMVSNMADNMRTVAKAMFNCVRRS